MRENLFRGKDIDGKWVEGCCVVDGMDANKVYIGYIFGSDGRQPHNTDVTLVDPETVCQYTGLTDKNGRKIFEGYILKIPEKKNHNVKFEYGQFCVGINCPIAYIRTECEVIGNIFDNPELIGE